LAEDRVNLLDEAERANQEDNEIDEDEHRNNGRDFDAIEAEEMVVDQATAEKIAKSGFNVQCLTDLWTTGLASIERDDIKQKRINTKKRFDRKLEIMREIGELIEATERLIEKDSAWREETYLPEEPDWLKDVKSLSKFG
jgi:predicted transcriptional regulator